MEGKEQMTGIHCCQNKFTEVRKTACWIQLLRKSNLFRKQLPFQNGLSSDKSDEYVCIKRGGGLVKDCTQDNSIDSFLNCTTWQWISIRRGVCFSVAV